MFCCIEDKVRFKELQSYFIVQMNAWGWVVAIIQKSRLSVYNSLIIDFWFYTITFFFLQIIKVLQGPSVMERFIAPP